MTQMNHWAFLPLYLSAVVLGQNITNTGEAHLLLWCVFGCIPIIFYFLRRYVHKAVFFFVAHLAVIAVMLFLPASNMVVRIFYICTGVIYILYSLALWIKTKDGQDVKLYPLLSAGISFVMLFFMNRLNCDNWNNVCMTALIFVISSYFVIYYIEQYLHFLVVNQSSASHIPAREMFRSGLGMVSVYTLLGIIILVFTTHMTWMKGIVDGIKNVLFAILRFLFGLLPQQEGVAEETISAAENMQALIEMNDQKLSGETGWFWTVVEYIMYIALVIAFAYVTVILLLKLFHFIRNRLGQRIVRENANQEEVFDVHEKLAVSRKKKNSPVNPFERLEPAARIRRMYRRKMLASENLLVREHNTEQLGRFTAREGEKILETTGLASTYEKARYSGEECTAEDVKRMRAACK